MQVQSKYKASNQKDAPVEDYWNVLKRALLEAEDRSCKWPKSLAWHKEMWWNDNVSNKVSEKHKLWKKKKQWNTSKEKYLEA